MDRDSTLDATFAALAHPARRAILERLAEGEATVNELAAPFDMSLPAISRHLKVLERAGLVNCAKSAQSRPRSLNVAPLDEVSDWTSTNSRIWQSRLDNLDREIRKMTKDKT